MHLCTGAHMRRCNIAMNEDASPMALARPTNDRSLARSLRYGTKDCNMPAHHCDNAPSQLCTDARVRVRTIVIARSCERFRIGLLVA
jgi:hypothetical protein